MEKMNKIILIFFVIVLIFSAGCVSKDAQRQEDYEKCTSVCSAVLTDNFVMMMLCEDECQKEFLEEE